MYSLITFLALVAVLFWLLGVEKGGFWPWLGFFVTVSLAIYTHLMMILLIPLFALWFLLSWPQSRRHSHGFLAAMAGLTLPYLPLLWWQWDVLTAKEQLTPFNFMPLVDVFRTILLYQSNSILNPQDLIYIFPIISLGLVAGCFGHLGICRRFGHDSAELPAWRRHLLVVTWIILPILCIYLISLRQPVFRPRYIIWIAPAIMMLMALGVRIVWQGKGRLAKVLATTLVMYVVVYWAYLGWQEKSLSIKADLRGAVTYVHAHRQPNDLLILQIPHNQFAYQYYSSDQGNNPFDQGDTRLGRWSAGLAPSADLEDDQARLQVDAQMRWMTTDSTDTWVVLSEVELVDPRFLMKKWLENNLILIDEVTFHGVLVQHYRPL